MKKQLGVLLLCVAALPLCARPDTIKMEAVSFPGNDISHPRLNVTKQLDVVPVNGPAEMRVNTNDSTTTPLVVNDTQVHEGASATFQATTLLTTGEGIGANAPTVVVGKNDDGTVKQSYAEFENLTITGDLPSNSNWNGLGLGTTTLQVEEKDSFSLFPAYVSEEGRVMKGCDRVGWKKYGTRVLLVCNPNDSAPEDPTVKCCTLHHGGPIYFPTVADLTQAQLAGDGRLMGGKEPGTGGIDEKGPCYNAMGGVLVVDEKVPLEWVRQNHWAVADKNTPDTDEATRYCNESVSYSAPFAVMWWECGGGAVSVETCREGDLSQTWRNYYESSTGVPFPYGFE